MSLLLHIFSCLAFYVVIFIKALKNCTGSIIELSIIFLHLLISYILTQLWIYSHNISLSGDIELNLGPKQDINQCFSVCHWNLNSITTSKIQSLIVYNCIHKTDIIWLSQSYLNSEFLSSDSNLQMPSYNFARIDDLSNIKCGGVCLYYKCSLPLKVINVFYLQEWIKWILPSKLLTLRLKLVIKYVTFSISVDPLAKLKINLRISLQISFGTHYKQKTIPNCTIRWF